MKYIIKRDGTKELFSKSKIEDAVYKASINSEGGVDRELAYDISRKMLIRRRNTRYS